MMEVFLTPPAPTRAMGIRFSARPMILPISSPRPKQALGGGGGNSPGGTLYRCKAGVNLVVFMIADPV